MRVSSGASVDIYSGRARRGVPPLLAGWNLHDDPCTRLTLRARVHLIGLVGGPHSKRPLKVITKDDAK